MREEKGEEGGFRRERGGKEERMKGDGWLEEGEKEIGGGREHGRNIIESLV